MARKISPRVADRAEALRELDNAADLAAEGRRAARPAATSTPSSTPSCAASPTLTAEGRLDEAAAAADAAVDQAEAGLSQLLDAAVAQHLLAFDAEGAARQIVRRVTLESGSGAPLRRPAQRVERRYQRGRDKGLRLDLEVAIALARQGRARARDADQRGAALNDLGNALASARRTGGGRTRLRGGGRRLPRALESVPASSAARLGT